MYKTVYGNEALSNMCLWMVIIFREGTGPWQRFKEKAAVNCLKYGHLQKFVTWWPETVQRP